MLCVHEKLKEFESSDLVRMFRERNLFVSFRAFTVVFIIFVAVVVVELFNIILLI